jgi:hypothetical protein
MGTTYRNPFKILQPNQINPRKLEKEEQEILLYKHMLKLVLCS